MAENGKIIRNGAEIQIDENGNVVARPAEGQELIVEDDARVGTLEAEKAKIDSESLDSRERLIDYDRIEDVESIDITIPDAIDRNAKRVYRVEIFEYRKANSGDFIPLELSFEGANDFDFTTKSESGVFERVTGSPSIELINSSSTLSSQAHTGIFEIMVRSTTPTFIGAGTPDTRNTGIYGDNGQATRALSSGSNNEISLIADGGEGDSLTLEYAIFETNRRDEI